MGYASSAPVTSTTRQNDRTMTSLPPRRGQIKARIFGSMVKTAAAAALKAGSLLGIHRAGDASSASEDSATPSTYVSDGDPDVL